jgi:hypothetical protein
LLVRFAAVELRAIVSPKHAHGEAKVNRNSSSAPELREHPSVSWS